MTITSHCMTARPRARSGERGQVERAEAAPGAPRPSAVRRQPDRAGIWLLALAATLAISIPAGAATDEVASGGRRSFKVHVGSGGLSDAVTIRGLDGVSTFMVVIPNEKRRRKSLSRGQEYEIPLHGFSGSDRIVTIQVQSGKVEVTYPSEEDEYVPGPLHPNRPRESFVPKGGEEEVGEGTTEKTGQTDRDVDSPQPQLDWNPPRANRFRGTGPAATEEEAPPKK